MFPRAWIDACRPDHYCERVTHVGFDELSEDGFCHVLCDADNTLLPWEASEVPSDVREAICGAREAGHIKGLCLISNVGRPMLGRHRRLSAIARSLGAEHVACFMPRHKPNPEPFLEAMAKIGATPASTVVIGDQLFTDILGGNRLGLRTILVDPIGKDHPVTLLKRFAEGFFLKRYAREWLGAHQLQL